ncbi:flavoprotein, partial [Peterkaempfera griseoplana]|uniref:flavoprotein n=1 Tax=Peterkaempfera griseoplana TaxID=66896 RepID=UPI000AB6A102
MNGRAEQPEERVQPEGHVRPDGPTQPERRGAAHPAEPPRVVLGVSGGIAAYKACELLRRLTESGHRTTVVPTASALHFVGEATWAALSGRPVATEVWETVHEVPHVRIGQQADLVVVAPATADLLAKAAH